MLQIRAASRFGSVPGLLVAGLLEREPVGERFVVLLLQREGVALARGALRVE